METFMRYQKNLMSKDLFNLANDTFFHRSDLFFIALSSREESGELQ